MLDSEPVEYEITPEYDGFVVDTTSLKLNQQREIGEAFTRDATKAWSKGDMRMCVVWMKHGAIDNDKIAEMLMDASYKLWKSLPNDCVNRKSEMELVIHAYNQVLANKDINVSPVDYIKLSNIYITEGAIAVY